MATDLDDLNAFVAVARAQGFREAARTAGTSASRLSDTVRRLEAQLGVRLFNRTTRSVALTQAGQELLARLAPALTEVEAALDAVNVFRDKPAGTLRLNVPLSAARLVLPSIVPAFLAAYPDIRLEVVAEESFVDVLAAGCDAGIRYDDRLEQDMIAVPIGPRVQRFAAGASPAYLDRHGRPAHPEALMQHACLRDRFPSGSMPPWEFERDGESVRVDASGPLVVQIGGAVDLAVAGSMRLYAGAYSLAPDADARTRVNLAASYVRLSEDWLRPHFESGALEPVLEPWWPQFSGPFLYYSGRRLVPSPLKALIDFIKAQPIS
mgnify:CR=1 FL=1